MKQLLLFLLIFSISTVIKAHEARTDTTQIPIPIIIPPSGGDPIQNPASSPTILAFQLEGEIVLRMSNLNVDFVEISIKNQVSNERLYFSNVKNLSSDIYIDISSFPIGFYGIEIIIDNEHYVGEFEVF